VNSTQTNNNLLSSKQALKISEVNLLIKSTLESQIGSVWVQGEISNFKPHSSGHYYFSLKDESSQIKAVMFKGYNSKLKFRPTEGMSVLARGQISSYPARGEYQIYVELLEPLGAGALQKAFEELKNKLRSEGLFDLAKKRPLPLYPQHIALVTSPTGAAIQDMVHVLKRRSKSVRITLVPALVQGAQAASDLCQALDKIYKLNLFDLIIIGRGGGSTEDLWPFNDEALARKLSQSPIPTISAVGHEVDFTITDFVADLRAPTPSAAAELAVKSDEEIFLMLQKQQRSLILSFRRQLEMRQQLLSSFLSRLTDPKKRLHDLLLKHDDLTERLNYSIKRIFQQKLIALNLLQKGLPDPKLKLVTLFKQIDQLGSSLFLGINQRFTLSNQKLKSQVNLLNNLNPLNTILRGYSVTKSLSDSKIITHTSEIKPSDMILTYLTDGVVTSQVTQVTKQPLLTFNHGSTKESL